MEVMELVSQKQNNALQKINPQKTTIWEFYNLHPNFYDLIAIDAIRYEL